MPWPLRGKEPAAERFEALVRRAYRSGDDVSEPARAADPPAAESLHDTSRQPEPQLIARHARPQQRRWLVSRPAALGASVVLALLAGLLLLRAGVLGSQEATSLPAAPSPTDEAVTPQPSPSAEEPATQTPDPEEPEEIFVHVAGEVHDPGIVTMSGSSRVSDAIAAAGGETKDAELAAINLARVLVDGEQVYVPDEESAQPGTAAGAPEDDAAAGADEPGDTVDLNAAGSSELETLPGIGPTIAERILTWREDNGDFHSVDELLEVGGIGPKRLEQIREQVRV